MSKHVKILLAVCLALFLAAPAMAATFEFHGDLNNRFKLYTDQQRWFHNDGSGANVLDDEDAPDTFATAKYRFWFTAASDDGAVKGVYAIEIGAIRYGDSTRGGGFSGDGVNVETRWAYTDFQLPSVASKARFQMGLIPFEVNKFFWSETAMGVKFYTDNWFLAWVRGVDTEASGGDDWEDNDLDSLSARYDLKMDPLKLGFFLSYLWKDCSGQNCPAFTDVAPLTNFVGTGSSVDNYQIKQLPGTLKFDVIAIGVDGSWNTKTGFGKLFLNWDVIYENGSVDDVSVDGGATVHDRDLSAYMGHVDVGVNFGAATLTYTLIYSSGDDGEDPNDDFEAFISVDVDNFYSMFFGEGGYTDDDYFTERYYVGDKGMVMNKLALDYALSKKTKLGASVAYLMLAEDATWTNAAGTATFKDDKLGVEVIGYVSHKLYDSLALDWNIGFLAADDAVDAFETGATRDGSSDVDIFQSTARVRYQF